MVCSSGRRDVLVGQFQADRQLGEIGDSVWVAEKRQRRGEGLGKQFLLYSGGVDDGDGSDGLLRSEGDP